jgi:outer membrane protein assembly factor BamB
MLLRMAQQSYTLLNRPDVAALSTSAAGGGGAKSARSLVLKHLKWCLVLLLAGLFPFLAQADWPEFRGPFGDGHIQAPGETNTIGLPLNWSETQNVKWKTEIPYRGWSTPVVQQSQVWLTTATPEGHDFFAVCVDAETGQVRFNSKLFHSDHPEPLGNNVNAYATPSPVIEPGRVYIHFGSYGTACLNTQDASVLWQRDDLRCRHYRGPSSSPVVFRDMLILTMDGVDLQYVIALDKKTGRTIWKTDRSVDWNDADVPGQMAREGDLRKAHSTPLVVNYNGAMQLLSTGAKAAYGYDPITGKELWRVHFPAWSAAPRPVYDGRLGFFVTGHGQTELIAVRLDGHGDVTDSHLAWKVDSMVPKTASPILVDELLYMASDDGLVTCLEASTGKQIWRSRIGGTFAASPIYGDGRIYFFSQQGKTTVIKPGRSLEVLATNSLPDGFMASPAVSGRALFLRTRSDLYRVEETAQVK